MANLAGLEKAAGDTAALFGRQPRILCVDDEEAGHIYMEALLAPQGYELVPAHTGEKALEILRNERIDLVLLDINMPDMDGYEVLAVLQENPATCRTPVIAITANALTRDVERGRAAGFLDYLTKPIDIASFLRVVDQALEDQRSARPE